MDSPISRRSIRSVSLTSLKSFSQPLIKNIGSLDRLGNFKLDPNLKSNLTKEDLSYWERLKSELFEPSDKEVQDEAQKIITEVLSEVVKHSPDTICPESFKSFLNETLK